MGLRTFLGRRMRDTRWVLALLTLLLAASVSIFLFLQRGRDLPAALLTNRVLLYLLWNLDAILIVAVLFILGRNLAKLLLERHHRILGAKFRTRLLASYFDVVFAANRVPHPGEKRLVEAAAATCARLPAGMEDEVTELLATAATDPGGLAARIDRLLDHLDGLLREEGLLAEPPGLR